MMTYNAKSKAPNTPEFMTTRWTMVLAAADMRADTKARHALEELVQIYWFPLYAYVRQQGRSEVEAEDLTQAFLTRLIEKHTLNAVDRTKGKFRSFLLTTFRNFIINEYKKNCAQKRGSGDIINFDVVYAENRYHQEPIDTFSPERIYEQRWAWAVLDQVLAKLREQYENRGQLALFEAIKGTLAASPEEVSHTRIAAGLEITENAVGVAVHRLRQRYRDMVRAEIAQTVADPSLIDDEIQYLLSCL